MRILLKLDRFAAWVLFAGLFLYFITGLGMTKGIISPALAYKFHLSYLTYFVLAGFVIHTSFAIHLAFKRWSIWNPVTKIILVLFYVSFVFFFVYIDKVYQPQRASVKIANSVSAQTNFPANQKNLNNSPVVAAKAAEKVFSVAELAKYDGQNGNPAYVAVDGAVYDLSSIFVGGFHQGFTAGQDLTAAFYSQHDKSRLAGFPVVGILK
jgi:predicted heme/steroid binding protein